MYVGVLTVFMAKLQSVRPYESLLLGSGRGGEGGKVPSREGLVSRRPGDDSGFVGWKWIELLTQTSELLCSSSLQGRANKTRGKVPVTSFLQPGGGLRRGRERFPGKHREGLEKQLHTTRRDEARL